MDAMAPFLATVAMTAFVVFLMWINAVRDTRTVLVKLFTARDAPEGPLIDCELRFPLYEVSTPCRAHAGATGLYLMPAPDAPPIRGWLANRGDLARPVFIPWWRIELHRARFPMRDWARFDIVNTKSCFFMREAKAMELLRAAGRTL